MRTKMEENCDIARDGDTVKNEEPSIVVIGDSDNRERTLEEWQLILIDEGNILTPSGNPAYVVKDLDNADIQKLTSMGYSIVAAEKALYKVPAHTWEKALKWLEQHELDANLDEPLPTIKATAMDKDLAEAEGRKLQAQIRANIQERERLEKREAAKNQLEQRRKALETRAALQEMEDKVKLQQLLKEKEESDKQAKAIQEKLINDYRERFGCDPPPTHIKSKNEKIDLSRYVTDIYNNNKNNPQCGPCIHLIYTYLNNIIANPFDLKYQTIKTSNSHFQKKIKTIPEALLLLEKIGFTKTTLEDGTEVYSLQELVTSRLSNVLKYLDLLKNRF